MMSFDYNGQAAYLVWYKQNLITSSLDTIYGQEILCRGFLVHTDKPIPMHELMPYLCRHNQLLLAVTCQQITDSMAAMAPSNSAKNKQTAAIVSTWINIAGQIIADKELFEQLWRLVLCTLSESQKQQLVLEVCEDDISSDIVFQRVSFLKHNGFVIAMDDFGSGHSNLQRLSQIPFDIIKLDLGLLQQVPTDLWSASFYREIVNLCSSTGGLIVAEGIESQLQSDFVRWAGVDLIQGFLYSKPEPFIFDKEHRI